MIAAQIESIFADVMAAKLPARTVYAYQSRNEELGDFAVIVEAAPEEVWLRDAAGRAQGWMIALAVNVLGYVEDVKADEEAFRELCEEAREALHNLTDEEVEAALPGAYSLSQWAEGDAAERGSEENYDRWTATATLHLAATGDSES